MRNIHSTFSHIIKLHTHDTDWLDFYTFWNISIVIKCESCVWNSTETSNPPWKTRFITAHFTTSLIWWSGDHRYICLMVNFQSSNMDMGVNNDFSGSMLACFSLVWVLNLWLFNANKWNINRMWKQPPLHWHARIINMVSFKCHNFKTCMILYMEWYTEHDLGKSSTQKLWSAT